LRDTLAAGAHIMTSRALWVDVAKDMLGIADGTMWGPYNVMPIPTPPAQ
jgi:hypothetical protein